MNTELMQKIKDKYREDTELPEVLEVDYTLDDSSPDDLVDETKTPEGFKRISSLMDENSKKIKEAYDFLEEHSPFHMAEYEDCNPSDKTYYIEINHGFLLPYESYKHGWNKLNAFRDTNTHLARALIKSPLFHDPEVKLDHVGISKFVSDYEPKTKEWLNSRNGTIGGSDVGKIALYSFSLRKPWKNKLDPYIKKAYKELIEGKSNPVEHLEDQEDSFEGPLYRGTWFEDIIFEQIRNEKRDELKSHMDGFEELVTCKSQFLGNYDWQLVNFDGIALDQDNECVGIVEIKNVSKPGDWLYDAKEVHSYNGVPIAYRAQVLNYLDATGVDKAIIYASICDTQLISRAISADEEIFPGSGSYESYVKKIVNPWYEKYILKNDDVNLPDGF